MEKSDGRKIVDTFNYVREIYRNIGLMLRSCDQLMDDNDFRMGDLVIQKPTLDLDKRNVWDTWFPDLIVRKYHKRTDQAELITIGALLWGLDVPVCLGCRMLIHPSDSNAWILYPRTPDHQVLPVQASDWPDKRWNSLRGQRLFSVSCPLLEVRDIDDIENRLVKPLLGRCLTELDPQANEEEQVRWLLDAAGHWSTTATATCRPEEVSWQVNLGLRYLNGQGVAQDNAKAEQWFHGAAEKGNHPLAESNLGIMYRDGLGVDQDDAKAVDWFRKAANQGNPNGQANLGFMFETGRGVRSKDVDIAKLWYRRAAEQGLEYAKNNLTRLEAKSPSL